MLDIGVIKCNRSVRRITKHGNTIVITGATDGIGKAITEQIANSKERLTLVLFGRSKIKLNAMKSHLSHINSRLDIQLFTSDFNDFNFDDIKSQFKKLPKIDVVFNNAGLSYPGPMYFHETSLELIDSLINVNLVSNIVLSKIILEHNDSHPVALIYTGSAASSIAEPLLAGYCGPKGAIESFACSLNAEFAGSKSVAQCQVPFLITTKMSKIRRPSLLVPTAAKYGEHAIKAVESASAKSLSSYTYPIVSPFVPHAVCQWLIKRVVPRSVYNHWRMTDQMKKRKTFMIKHSKPDTWNVVPTS